MQKLLKLKIISKKIQKFDSSYFRGKNYFDEDDTQNYLVFLPIFIYFKINTINNCPSYTSSWQSNGLSSESTKPLTTFDNIPTPTLSYYDAKTFE